MNIRFLIFLGLGVVLLTSTELFAQSAVNSSDEAKPGTPVLMTETFNVPLNFLDLVASTPTTESDPFAPEVNFTESAESDPFAPAIPDSKYSIFFDLVHTGATAIFNREEGTLVVTSTAEKLRKLGEVVATFPKLTEAQERALVSDIIQMPAGLVEGKAIQLTEEKLVGIRIPKISFEKQPLGDVLGHIQSLSKEYDKLSHATTRKGVEFNLLGWDLSDDTMVTLERSDISLKEVLVQVLNQVGFKYRIYPVDIVVLPAREDFLELIPVKYQLPEGFYEKLSVSPPDPFAPERSSEKEMTAQMVLENKGVSFLFGARAWYEKETRELYVTIDSEQLDLVEGFLSGVDGGKMIFGIDSRFHKKE